MLIANTHYFQLFVAHWKDYGKMRYVLIVIHWFVVETGLVTSKSAHVRVQ
jgi:hypothetical protein